MPWKIVKGHSRCPNGFAVVKTDGSGFRGCHESREKAKAQLAALYSSEPMAGQSKHKPKKGK